MKFAFIGDSYTLGAVDDASANGYGFAGKVAVALGVAYQRWVTYTFPATFAVWSEIEAYAPDVIVIELGIHVITGIDSTTNTNALFEAAVIEVMERAKLITDHVIYVSVSWRASWSAASNDRAQVLNEIIQAQAAAYGVVFVNIYGILEQLGMAGVGYDGAHPNGVGHQAIADAILLQLIPEIYPTVARRRVSNFTPIAITAPLVAPTINDPLDELDSAMLGGAQAGDQILKEWVEGADIELTAVTYDSDGVISSATVKWPDGSAGVLTRTVKDSTWLGINAYIITHASSGKTVTQATVTRDGGNGGVTVKPALAVG